MNRVVDAVDSTVQVARRNEITFLAASISFYAFFSIVPLVLLVVSIGTLVGAELLAERILSLTGTYLSADGEAVLGEALTDPAGRFGASAIGLAALIWSALKVFRAIDISFERIYGAEESASLPRRLLDGVLVILTIVAGTGLLIAARTLVDRAGVVSVPYIDVVGWFVLIGGLIVVFVPLYYLMPPVSVSVREILPGTATAVVGWLLLQTLFGIYAANAAQYRAYGLIGAVLLFLLWLHVGAILLLFGAVVNVVVADRRP